MNKKKVLGVVLMSPLLLAGVAVIALIVLAFVIGVLQYTYSMAGIIGVLAWPALIVGFWLFASSE